MHSLVTWVACIVAIWLLQPQRAYGQLDIRVQVTGPFPVRVCVPMGNQTVANITVAWDDLSIDTWTTLARCLPGVDVFGPAHNYSFASTFRIRITELTVNTIQQLGWNLLDPNAGWDKFPGALLTALQTFSTVRPVSTRYLFLNAGPLFNNVPTSIPNSITDMTGMFYNTVAFNDNDVASWSMTAVRRTDFMFSEATAFNRALNNWQVAFITSMTGMFAGAVNMRGNCSNWCVRLIPSEPVNFDLNTPLWNETHKPQWGQCPNPPIPAVSPILECSGRIYTLDNETCMHWFGYNHDNASNFNVTFPIGTNNRFNPVPIDRGQPTVFTPGRFVTVFNVSFPCNITSGTYVWQLGPRTTTASYSAARVFGLASCTSLPPLPPIAPPILPPLLAPTDPSPPPPPPPPPITATPNELSTTSIILIAVSSSIGLILVIFGFACCLCCCGVCDAPENRTRRRDKNPRPNNEAPLFARKLE